MALKWNLDKIKEFIENEGYEFIEYVSGIGKESRIKVWCKNNNIKLIRISYLDYDNIEEILKEKLNLE